MITNLKRVAGGENAAVKIALNGLMRADRNAYCKVVSDGDSARYLGGHMLVC